MFRHAVAVADPGRCTNVQGAVVLVPEVSIPFPGLRDEQPYRPRRVADRLSLWDHFVLTALVSLSLVSLWVAAACWV